MNQFFFLNYKLNALLIGQYKFCPLESIKCIWKDQPMPINVQHQGPKLCSQVHTTYNNIKKKQEQMGKSNGWILGIKWILKAFK